MKKCTKTNLQKRPKPGEQIQHPNFRYVRTVGDINYYKCTNCGMLIRMGGEIVRHRFGCIDQG